MRSAVFSTALLLSQAINAATPINGWYNSLFGGYTYLPGNVNRTYLDLTHNNTNFKSGFDVGGSLGFKCNPMRYEGELTYLRANLNGFNINGIRQTGVNGYSQAVLAMANVYYDFPGFITPSIEPYLGAGIGYGWIQSKLNSTGPAEFTSFSPSDSVFAYQGTAGLTYNFAETYALTLAYRYVATTTAPQLGEVFQAHIANVGAVYRFDGSNYK